jgi:hypothetical protein
VALLPPFRFGFGSTIFGSVDTEVNAGSDAHPGGSLRFIDLRFNQGLAVTDATAIAAVGDTAMNPAALDAFALVETGPLRPRRISAR